MQRFTLECINVQEQQRFINIQLFKLNIYSSINLLKVA